MNRTFKLLTVAAFATANCARNPNGQARECGDPVHGHSGGVGAVACHPAAGQ